VGGQSGWRTAALVFLVVAVLLGWLYVGAVRDRDAAEADRIDLVRAHTDAAQAAAARFRDMEKQLEVAGVQSAVREERFELMSFACARLVNTYVDRMKYLELLTQRYFETGVSAAELQDALLGYVQSNVYEDPGGELLRTDRAGCGMREKEPTSLSGDDYVEPLPKAWVNGVKPVGF
jgi:hypothetical protein